METDRKDKLGNYISNAFEKPLLWERLSSLDPSGKGKFSLP